jgi:hypothetical protein
MKVFISWSGGLSLGIAQLLKVWLRRVMQHLDPYVSTEDIRKGKRWSESVRTELEQTIFGITCLTPDNLDAPWIHYEAGAISKGRDENSLCALMCGGVGSEHLPETLQQFQATLPEKTDMARMMKALNEASGSKLSETELTEAFDHWWPSFDKPYAELLSKGNPAKPQRRDQYEVLIEVLEAVRSLQRSNANPHPDYIIEELLKTRLFGEPESKPNAGPAAPIAALYGMPRHGAGRATPQDGPRGPSA